MWRVRKSSSSTSFSISSRWRVVDLSTEGGGGSEEATGRRVVGTCHRQEMAVGREPTLLPRGLFYRAGRPEGMSLEDG